ncbi:hypothetical protein ACA910_009409 [Epithemia clementina (nom. ined.)]
MSPPLLVFKDMSRDLSENNFRAAITFNVEEVHASQITLAQEAKWTNQLLREQAVIINMLSSKVNVLSGLLGVPSPDLDVPTLCQAVSILTQQVSSLGNHMGISLAQSQTQETREQEERLLRAEIQDLRRHTERVEANTTRIQQDMKFYQHTATMTNNKIRNLEMVLEAELDRIIEGTVRREVLVQLRQVESLLMHVQHFLDKILPTMASNQGTVFINESMASLFDQANQQAHPPTQGLEPMSVSELLELASAILIQFHLLWNG